MRRIKLKKWVLPTFMLMMIISLIGLTYTISNSIYNKMNGDNYTYVLRGLKDDNMLVLKEVDDKIKQPFDNENVTILINYYDSSSKQEEQEKSLILYERTYMPNSGILYSSSEKFEVTASLEGKVTSVKEDELLGNVIEIEHENDIVTRYSSLSSVDVNVGDTVSTGEVLGYSGINKISAKSQNMLLFEIIVKGYNENPTKYFDKSINEIK